MSKNELKPCPFCGNAAKIRTNVVNEVKYYQVYCPNKNCSCMPNTIQWINQENAVNAWNNRPYSKPYKFNYNEEEVKNLAEERKITEAKARYLIYQREYNKKYRKENKERLKEYYKKYRLKRFGTKK